MSSTTSVFTVITTKLNAGQSAANTGAGAQNADGSYSATGVVLGTAQTVHAGVELAKLGTELGRWFPVTGLGLSVASSVQPFNNIQKAWDKNLPINQSDIAALVGSAAGMGGAAIVLVGASGPIMVGVAAAALTTSVAAGGYQLYAQAKGLTWDPVAGKTVEVALTAEQRTQIDLHLQQSLPLWNQTSTLVDLGLPIGTKFQTTGSVFSGPTSLTATVKDPTDAATRNSASYITDTSANDHLVIIKTGGLLSDAWALQKNSATGFANAQEFYAAVLACNPSITNANNIPAGSNLYLPEKFADGSITYNYAGGTAINSNATTGEYHMVVQNADGGQTVYSRSTDGDAGYVVKRTTTNAAGQTTYDFTGHQSTLGADITPITAIQKSDTDGNGSLDKTVTTTQVSTGVVETKTDLNGDGKAEMDVLTQTGVSYNLLDLSQRTSAESGLRGAYNSGSISNSFWSDFTSQTTGMLVGGLGLNPNSSGVGLQIPSSMYDPIGAFYESKSAGKDPALSIKSAANSDFWQAAA